MNTQSRGISFAGAFEALGVPERIWAGYWSIVSVIWIASARFVEDFAIAAVQNALLLIAVFVVPHFANRFGNIGRDLSRATFSFISAWFGYERMAAFVAAFRTRSYEYEMLKIDEFLFGGNPSVWFEAIYHPYVSEYFQILYWFYFPQMLLVGLTLIAMNKRKIFFRYVITMNLALMFTHTFYFIVPLRSPFYIVELGEFTDLISYSQPLVGVFFFDTLRESLTNATTMRHDCFPSGHTMHSLLALIFAWRAHKFAGIIETIIATSIVISTLYLRYHYAIDLVVGAVSAVIFYYLGGWITARTWRGDNS